MRYIFCLLLLCSATVYAQDTKRCEFVTDGSANFGGLKIKFAVPCDWKPNDEKDKAGTKTYNFTTDDYAFAETISIQKPKKPLTEESLDKMVSADNYKDVEKKGVKFLWGRKLKIDNMDCAEYALLMKKKIMFHDVVMYMVNYTFLYKGQSVTVLFVTTGEKEKIITEQFNAHKAQFLNLAMATDFLN